MINKTLFPSFLALGMLLNACTPSVSSQTSGIQPSPQQVSSTSPSLVVYRCDNGVEVQAFYGNKNQVKLTLKNRLFTLPYVPSADGVRYSNGNLTWWTRGSQGTLQDGNRVTAANCQDTASPTPIPAAQQVTLTPDDAKRTTSILLGSTITLRLPSNVTTGYRYEVQSTFNPAVLEYLGSMQEGSSTGLVGAPGVQVFTFQATRIGTGVITVAKKSPAGKIVEILKFLISVNFTGKI